MPANACLSASPPNTGLSPIRGQGGPAERLLFLARLGQQLPVWLKRRKGSGEGGPSWDPWQGMESLEGSQLPVTTKSLEQQGQSLIFSQ